MTILYTLAVLGLGVVLAWTWAEVGYIQGRRGL